MQTKISLSAYEHRVLLTSLWSVPELSQAEREANYDLALSLGLGNDVYALALRGRLKDIIQTPEHLMVPPSEKEDMTARVKEMNIHQDKIVEQVEAMHNVVIVHVIDASHLKHLIAMLDKVKGPQVPDQYFLASIGMKARQVLAAASS